MENEMHLIDANKLMVCHINVGTVMFPKMEAFVRAEDIKAAPIVDAVEVVRCKYCKHYHKNTCPHWAYTETKPDDFCSYGERRNDDGQSD